MGEVDARLLDAATRLFLAVGFERTTCDRVAILAGAGKGSLYARYPNKEALFSAAVRRMVTTSAEKPAEYTRDEPLASRLRSVGVALMREGLEAECLAMTRMVAANANRFPELARLTDQIAWQGAIDRVSRAIVARTDASADAMARVKTAAEKFLSLTFAPQQMRALFGHDRALLEATVQIRVDDAIALLISSGSFDGWE